MQWDLFDGVWNPEYFFFFCLTIYYMAELWLLLFPLNSELEILNTSDAAHSITLYLMFYIQCMFEGVVIIAGAGRFCSAEKLHICDVFGVFQFNQNQKLLYKKAVKLENNWFNVRAYQAQSVMPQNLLEQTK